MTKEVFLEKVKAAGGSTFGMWGLYLKHICNAMSDNETIVAASDCGIAVSDSTAGGAVVVTDKNLYQCTGGLIKKDKDVVSLIKITGVSVQKKGLFRKDILFQQGLLTFTIEGVRNADAIAKAIRNGASQNTQQTPVYHTTNVISENSELEKQKLEMEKEKLRLETELLKKQLENEAKANVPPVYIEPMPSANNIAPVFTNPMPVTNNNMPIENKPVPKVKKPARFCSACGNALKPNAKFCAGCGKQIG